MKEALRLPSFSNPTPSAARKNAPMLELLEMADAHVRIPMLGQKKSLNVVTAGGVVLYELLRKWRMFAENSK